MAIQVRGEDSVNSSLIVCSHLSGEGWFHSQRHTVKPVECRGDCDYWQALDALWDTDLTIVNVEHDIDVTDRHVDELLSCPHPLCTWAYECHFATTGMPESIIAAGTGDWARHLHGGEEWADWSAIGLVKITPGARVGRLVSARWQQLERSVHKSVQPPWHVHWPLVDHHHW